MLDFSPGFFPCNGCDPNFTLLLVDKVKDFNFVAEEFPEQCSVRRRSDKLEGLEILPLPSFRVCPGDVGDEGGGRGAGLLVGRLRSVRRSPERRLTGGRMQ